MEVITYHKLPDKQKKIFCDAIKKELIKDHSMMGLDAPTDEQIQNFQHQAQESYYFINRYNFFWYFKPERLY